MREKRVREEWPLFRRRRDEIIPHNKNGTKKAQKNHAKEGTNGNNLNKSYQNDVVCIFHPLETFRLFRD